MLCVSRPNKTVMAMNIVLGLGLLAGLALMASGIRLAIEHGLAGRGLSYMLSGLTAWIVLAGVGQRIRRRLFCRVGVRARP